MQNRKFEELLGFTSTAEITGFDYSSDPALQKQDSLRGIQSRRYGHTDSEVAYLHNMHDFGPSPN